MAHNDGDRELETFELQSSPQPSSPQRWPNTPTADRIHTTASGVAALLLGAGLYRLVVALPDHASRGFRDLTVFLAGAVAAYLAGRVLIEVMRRMDGAA